MRGRDYNKLLQEAILSNLTQSAKEILSDNFYGIDFHEAFGNAAKRGNTDLLKTIAPLLDKDDIEAQDSYMAQHEVDDMDRYTDIRIESFNKALGFASENGHIKSFKYILDRYSEYFDVNDVLYHAYKCGLQEFVGGYIERCTSDDVDITAKRVVQGVISLACEKDDLDCLIYFVDTCKLDMEEYQACIFNAALYGNIRIVKHLVNNNVNLNVRGRSKECVHVEVVNRLDEYKERAKDTVDTIYYSYVNSSGERWCFDSRDELNTAIDKLQIVCDYLEIVTDDDAYV